MLRERVIQELSIIREKRIAEDIEDAEAKEEIMAILTKFCEDIGFIDISGAVIEAWQDW
jgi:hypothetical protein